MVLKAIQAGLAFFMATVLIIPCYGLSREDVISSTLDYYRLVREKKEIEQKVQEIKKKELQEKQERQQSRAQKRQQAIKKILNMFEYTFETKQIYDDNLFFTNTDQKDDFLRTVEARIMYYPDLSTKRPQRWLTFNSGVQALFYDQNTDGNTVDFDLKGKATQLIGNHYDVSLHYGLSKKQQTGTEILETETETTFNEVWDYSYGANFAADWNKFPWEIDYQRDEFRYNSEKETSNYDQDLITLTNYYSLWPKTDLLFSYQHGIITYPHKNNDYTSNKYSFGIRGQISPKITGVAKFGWGSYKFEDSEENIENISIDLTYNALSRLLFNFVALRSILPTTSEADRSKEVSSLSLSCTYSPPFSKRLTLKGDLSYKDLKYSTITNEVYRISLTAKYLLRQWLSLEGRYAYTERFSTRESNEYTKNIISLGLKVDF
ncbi:MAG: outer membrane beta-barrel protein [Candidatus Omnitrophica bacterium]|nr:outer membrane beta-barrel protein [Candidatus Omnitrophota bacterium]